MADNAITDDDINSGREMPELGAHYFSARRFADGLLKNVEPDVMKPVIDKIAEQLIEAVWDATKNWLLTDTEANVQGHIWEMVDRIVSAILGGEEWAVKTFALGNRYNTAKIREALVRQFPDELRTVLVAERDKQIAELKKEIARLNALVERIRNERT